jgi:hypothetical protein
LILVDTSVWIRSFMGKEPYFHELHRLTVEKQVVAHDLVYGELLIGDLGGRTRFLADYELATRAPVASHPDVVFLARERKLHGRGLSWIGVHLLASALVGRLRLWSADETLSDAAEELGICYSPRKAR